MSTYNLPHFKPIDLGSPQEYYSAQIEFNNNELELDLNFWGEAIEPKRLDLVKNILDNLKEFDSKNRKYIEADYADESADTVKTYVDHHLTEFTEEDLAGHIDFTNTSITPEKQLINALHLVRVGFYPDEGEDQIAVFDYSLGDDVTNYLIVIFINTNGELDHITMES
jgi:hypothetical protein